MATFCLTKQTIERFKKALKDRELDPFSMANMTSEQRRALLEKYVGENAKEVNALFESKLLLKNQKAGYQSWAKKVAGISPQVKRDMISKIERLDKVLSPTEEKQFLQDLAESRLGVEVTVEEAKAISDLSQKLTKLKESWDAKAQKWSSENDAKLYGSTQRALEVYIEELKEGKKSISKALRERGYQFKSEAKENIIRATGSLLADTAKAIAETSVQAVATFDDSFFGRQGIFNLLSGHPIIWSRNFAKSFVDIAKTFGGKKTTDALLADLYSDPLYMNGEYQKAGILNTTEEQYPTNILNSLPVLGKPIEAFEAAFTNGSLRMRTEMYKLMRDAKVARGIEMTDKEIEGTARVANSLSARGHLDYRLKNPIVRLLMWAPSMLKADIDVLTAHSFADIPKSDRVTARWNLIKIIAITALLNTIAQASGKDVELDPRSSDFLKFDKKYGYLRGIPQIITLFSRMLTGEYKNAQGEIIEYESGIGKRSRLDAIYSFLRGKAPPATGAMYDVLAGEDYQGNEPTFTSILMQRGVPISMQNLIKLSKDPSIDKTFGIIADFFGLNSDLTPSTNTESKMIPQNEVTKSGDIIEMVKVYAEALGADPEVAFNRFFTGQKIIQVSPGKIIVVERQSVPDSQKFKRDWVKKHGGNIKDIKEVRLDHVIPNKLGGSEDASNWAVVPKAMWASNTRVETTLIEAVKKDKIKLKDAQALMRRYKRPSIDKYGYATENPDKKLGERIVKKYK